MLVVDARRLEWRRQADEQLQSVLTGAIQIVAVQERAAAAGIGSDELLALVAPVPVESVELGSFAGRSPDDEMAVMIMTVLLFIAISTYGNLVLTGVVEEKSSRVVEVLLARIPARSLLAGKVAGIGLLGLAQFGLTALVAFVATTMVDSVDLPSVSAGVLAWVVVWFVLGYALYAMVYGALGSLASRTEDAQSVSGPVIVVLMAGYFASFVAVGRPDSGVARLASLFPPTAPLAMPSRIAMGAVAWWEPMLAVVLTVASDRRSAAARRPRVRRRHPPHRPHAPATRRLARADEFVIDRIDGHARPALDAEVRPRARRRAGIDGLAVGTEPRRGSSW